MNVQPGQVWRSAEPRSCRYVRVLAVWRDLAPGYAAIVDCDEQTGVPVYGVRPTVSALWRFGRSNGFRYVGTPTVHGA